MTKFVPIPRRPKEEKREQLEPSRNTWNTGNNRLSRVFRVEAHLGVLSPQTAEKSERAEREEDCGAERGGKRNGGSGADERGKTGQKTFLGTGKGMEKGENFLDDDLTY